MISTSKGSVANIVIDDEMAGQRLDNYLFRTCKGVPKSHIYRVLRHGEVRVNSGRADAAYRLQAGDRLRIPPLRVAAQRDYNAETAHAMAHTVLPAIFEDAALIAIDKPAGIAVHGGSGVSFGVIETLRRQKPQTRFIELAHRLDRETSGLLLVAKKRSALTVLHEMFRQNRADKRYWVLVAGRFPDPVRHARWPLHKYVDENGERRVRIAADGKPAHTVFRLLIRWQRFSLLEAELRSGRTHQIRVHLAHMGHPVLGDEKYGDFALNKALAKEGLKRMFLHAAKLDCLHPLSGTPLHLRSPLPVELQRFIDYLSQSEQKDYEQAF